MRSKPAAPFKCCKCKWTEPHGHRDKLAISIKDLVSRGGYAKLPVGTIGSTDQYIELVTIDELVERLAKMGGPEFMLDLAKKLTKIKR